MWWPQHTSFILECQSSLFLASKKYFIVVESFFLNHILREYKVHKKSFYERKLSSSIEMIMKTENCIIIFTENKKLESDDA